MCILVTIYNFLDYTIIYFCCVRAVVKYFVQHSPNILHTTTDICLKMKSQRVPLYCESARAVCAPSVSQHCWQACDECRSWLCLHGVTGGFSCTSTQQREGMSYLSHPNPVPALG